MSMSPLSIHRSLSAIASGLALSFAISASAQTEQKPAFPTSCDKFGDVSPVNKSPYSPVSRLIEKQLRNYSHWDRLMDGLKQNGVQIDGLCPLVIPGDTPVDIDPDTKSIDYSIINQMRQQIPPAAMMAAIKEGSASYAGAIITGIASMQGSSENQPIIAGDEGLHNILLLGAVIKAYTTSELVMFATEAATEDNQKSDLNALYETWPTLVSEINDAHAMAIIAKKKNRSLSESERGAIRESLFTKLLQDTKLRDLEVQIAVNTMVSKMTIDVVNGQKASLPPSNALDLDLVISRLKRLPGNIDTSPAIMGYHSYWQSRREKDVGLRSIEPRLSELPGIAERNAEQQKSMRENTLTIPVNPHMLRPQ